MKSNFKLIVMSVVVFSVLSMVGSAGAVCTTTTKSSNLRGTVSTTSKSTTVSSSYLRKLMQSICGSWYNNDNSNSGTETPATPSQPEAPAESTQPNCPNGICESETPSTNETESPSTPSEQPSDSSSSASSSYVTEVIRLVNVERAKEGLSALTENTALSQVAQLKSQDMCDNKYFSHTSPTYGSPFDMMKKYGITYKTAGENIAMGYKTPAAVVEGWMNSSGHRANILSSSFTQIGVGYVQSGNYWTQMFIG